MFLQRYCFHPLLVGVTTQRSKVQEESLCIMYSLRQEISPPEWWVSLKTTVVRKVSVRQRSWRWSFPSNRETHIWVREYSLCLYGCMLPFQTSGQILVHLVFVIINNSGCNIDLSNQNNVIQSLVSSVPNPELWLLCNTASISFKDQASESSTSNMLSPVPRPGFHTHTRAEEEPCKELNRMSWDRLHHNSNCCLARW